MEEASAKVKEFWNSVFVLQPKHLTKWLRSTTNYFKQIQENFNGLRNH